MGCGKISRRRVAKTRNPDIVKRNDVIYSEWLRGASLTDLGAKHHLARQVVGRIVAAFHPEEDEDDDRALYRGYMWRLYDEVQQIGDHPGWKMSPQGGTAYGPDGEPALDTNVQVQAKELQMKIIRELRLLDGRDRPSVKKFQFERSEAEQKMWAEIDRKRAEMEDLARKAGTIPGQVIREIEG